jgi:hypothetical protein
MATPCVATRYPWERMRRKASSRARFTPASTLAPREEAKLIAGIQQFVETRTRALSASGRAELDVTRLLAALGPRSIKADCEAIQNATRVCQDDVAGVLRQDSLDFLSEIESRIDLVCKFPACLDGLFTLALSACR